MTDEPKLRQSYTTDGRPERFVSSRYRCPQCGGAALVDNYPPNYGGFVSTGNGSGQGGSTIKHICTHCKIAFVVSTFYFSGTVPPEFAPYIAGVGAFGMSEGHRIGNITPLVERDGYLLTPMDVTDYEYHDKHGEWPVRSYG